MKKILIAEDEVSIANMYMYKLQKEGYEAVVAVDGVEALKLAGELKPELILLDLLMPQMSGDEMLEKLRQTDWGSKIRVVVLTNISRDEAPSKLRLLNVDRYIVKAHTTPAEVVKIVREVLNGR